ncbi:MAG: alpha/beta hydrolase [Bdellovibrionales bacterium]|nr:alpha/beta hydrolase [Bdellovibrionales bacterium]
MQFAKLFLLSLVAVSFLGLGGAQARPAEEKTIVLVHGAFADGSSWQKVIPLLKAKGYKVIAVQNPLSSLDDDVKVTKRIVNNQQGPVILVGHSWGGMVISELGSNPKVAALVYVAAFAPAEGDSVASLLASAKVPAPGLTEVVADNEGYLSMSEKGVREHFAPDLTPAEQDIVYAVQGPIFGNAFGTKTSVATWRSVPSWYIIADQDHMIPPDVQNTMSQRVGSKVTHVASSHVPMLSKPDEVAKVILEAADQSGN